MPWRRRVGRSEVVVVAFAVVVLTLVAARSRPAPGAVALSRAPVDTAAPPSTTSTTTTSTTATAPSTTAPPTTTPPTTAAPPAPAPPPQPAASAAGTTLLVWTSGGLPPGFAADVAAVPEVSHSTLVHGDLIRLHASRDASGTTVDAAPEGWAFPIDGFAIDPAGYAAFQPEPDAATLAALRPGEAVLTESSAQLRRIGVGGALELSGGPVAVTGIVADEAGGGAEVLVHRSDATRLGIDDERFLLVADTDRAAVEAEIRRRTPPGEYLSLRSSAQARWLRHGDRVEPQARVKRAFGEFVFRDTSGRDIEIDPAWVAANIVTESVPLLGTIRCHRAVLPAVRAAMEDLERAGKGHVVRADQYAGCQYARRIAPGAGLSRHTWGIALDLNIGRDPRGTFESQDPALVEAMTSRGFSWGGEWEYPDPGHYEFVAAVDG